MKRFQTVQRLLCESAEEVIRGIIGEERNEIKDGEIIKLMESDNEKENNIDKEVKENLNE